MTTTTRVSPPYLPEGLIAAALCLAVSVYPPYFRTLYINSGFE